MNFHNQISTKSITTAIYMNLTCDAPTIRLPDGSEMCTNEAGAVVFMHYASGVKLRRYNDFVICFNQLGEHWIGDSRTAWYRLN